MANTEKLIHTAKNLKNGKTCQRKYLSQSHSPVLLLLLQRHQMMEEKQEMKANDVTFYQVRDTVFEISIDSDISKWS